MENVGIKFTSYDNSVTWVEDIEKAQHLADKFIEKKWYATFDSFAGKINSFLPRIKEIFSGHAYHWFVEQCEYATDVMFKDREQLALQMPRHGFRVKFKLDRNSIKLDKSNVLRVETTINNPGAFKVAAPQNKKQ